MPNKSNQESYCLSTLNKIPPQRPRLPDEVRHYSSKLDETKGPLRTTADGNLMEEDTGDWLVLDTPPHDSEDRELSVKKDKQAANAPTIGLPEAMNGATGLDDPRARRPITRVLRNKFYGFDRPPVEEESPLVVARRKLRRKIEELRKDDDPKPDIIVLSRIRENYTVELCPSLGGGWFEQAMVDDKFWLLVLDRVLELGVD